MRAGHARHVDARSADVAVENFPAAQRVQGPAPVSFLNDPARHASHAAPAGPKWPELQVQSVMAPAPAAHEESKGHRRHAVAVAREYEPAAHGRHGSEPALRCKV